MNKVNYKELLGFYKGKKVLVTGNTGFKGSWLTYMLLRAGADVIGYALQPPTDPNLFFAAGLDKCGKLTQVYGDVRDLELLENTFRSFRPEIVLHLAAQPIVRDSYRYPVDTYSINVMGTVNVLECIRTVPGVRSFLNVTTDKVYRNVEWEYSYRENDVLDGLDPYSNSKSCSELVTHSYIDSFFGRNSGTDVRISTARAGNVIGGGDFANDRILPDCVRALAESWRKGGTTAVAAIRNPYSIRPYQHVLEPLFVYLLIVKSQYEDKKFSSYYNVGPDAEDCVSTGDLATLFADIWNDTALSAAGVDKSLPAFAWEDRAEIGAPHEANFLKLDCSKLKAAFNWKPVWHIGEAVSRIVSFTHVWLQTMNSADKERIAGIRAEMDSEIEDFINHTS